MDTKFITKPILSDYLEKQEVTLNDCFNDLKCRFCKYSTSNYQNETVTANDKIIKHLVRCQNFISFMHENKNLRRHLGLAFKLAETDQLVYTFDPPAHFILGDEESSVILTNGDYPDLSESSIRKITMTTLTCTEKITSLLSTDASLPESSSPQPSSSRSSTPLRSNVLSFLSSLKRSLSRSPRKTNKTIKSSDPFSFVAIANAVSANEAVSLEQSKRSFRFTNNNATNIFYS